MIDRSPCYFGVNLLGRSVRSTDGPPRPLRIWPPTSRLAGGHAAPVADPCTLRGDAQVCSGLTEYNHTRLIERDVTLQSTRAFDLIR